MSKFPAIPALLAAVLATTSCHGSAMQTGPFTDPAVARLADAVEQGDAYVIRTLLDENGDPDARGEGGLNLLQHAIFKQSRDGLEALLAAGADPNLPGYGGSTAMHTAALVDDPAFLELLLAHGGNPDARHAESGETPLAQAVGPRTAATFRRLLAAGADPGAADRTGNTPLHRAAMINAGAHVLQLLEAGADPQAKNAQDATFQPYYFGVPADVLSDRARAEREAVRTWLRRHDVPLEAGSDA
ncbi:ankyrin repeat domain-containing protein [Luteimonas sp. R10]|uniref:ankyrin repeat domain-containing protein n=1 Tax=Luteimonas sp. R10 TaxID=3108176 RepID=UPI003090B5E4|nr:ankyrin repeat domain-containing protein [Luteimonas sp. R10]